MQRRDFLGVLGGAAATWPLAVRAQQPNRVRQIGWLVGLRQNDPEALRRTLAFVQQLEHLGWTIGHNIQIEYRWLSDSVEHNDVYAQELAALKPDVLVAEQHTGGESVTPADADNTDCLCCRHRSGQ
jgi:putative ABC transport system substrate-binding protein